MLSLRSTLELNNGVAIPRLGLGVFRAESGKGGPAQRAVAWALEEGYRHVDTAHIYRNEADVGAALRASAVDRSEVFITTKLWNADHGFDAARLALDASLAALGVSEVDLFLMHWPVARLRRESWRAMEACLAEGKCRAIGVSNFTPRHLDDLLSVAEVVPAINQIELHPFLPQHETVAACAAHDIAVEAYCPLTRAKRLDDPTVGAVARAVARTPAQVLIRWSLQKGYVVLPKSEKRARIVENASVYDFSLTEEQMGTLDGLEDGFRVAWDPTDAP